MADKLKQDVLWQNYLIEGLKVFTKHPFIMKELGDLTDEVATKKNKRLEDGMSAESALNFIAGDIWAYNFIDWKVPEYYALCLTDFIDKGSFNYDLIKSPITLIVGRNGNIRPQQQKLNRYLRKHMDASEAMDDAVYLQIEKGAKPKDIAKFIEIYFSYIEMNNYIISKKENTGTKYKSPNIKALEVIAKCLDEGVNDVDTIAAELDEQCPKPGDSEWTGDAVRLRLKYLAEIHEDNPYVKEDQLNARYEEWLEEQENS